MIDYSFIRLKDNFADAKNIGDSPSTEIGYYDSIQLLPDESYFQLTNVEGGISFEGSYEVYLVDCNDIGLKDVTNHIFITETTSENGTNQLEIEIVNLNTDFYRETLFFRFKSLISNQVYYSNPLNVTSYQKHLTTYFKYKNFEDFEGIPYTNSQKFQSIRVKTYFDIPVNEPEISDYFRISRNNTISTRPLLKRFEQYNLEEINRFTYDRLSLLFLHDIIYVDNVRMTNKVNIESSERLGNSNLFNTNYTISKDYNDVSIYQYQIFTGFNYQDLSPLGNITLAQLNNTINIGFNLDVALQVGTINLYNNETNELIHSFTESDMYLDDSQTIGIDGLGTYITSNGSYYFKVSAGLVQDVSFGLYNEAITDIQTWSFNVLDADFNNSDFNNSDFFTG